MNAYITTTSTSHDDDLAGTYVSEDHPHLLVQNGYVSTVHSDQAEGEYVDTADSHHSQHAQHTLPVAGTGPLATAVAH